MYIQYKDGLVLNHYIVDLSSGTTSSPYCDDGCASRWYCCFSLNIILSVVQTIKYSL